MAKYNVHAGHNSYVPGANGYFSEIKENRIIKDKVIKLLKEEGHEVYDCTDDLGKTVNSNLLNIVSKCNKTKVDLDISIHFNAFDTNAYGVEVFEYDNSTNDISNRICKNIESIGYRNRGVKDGSELYVLKNTISKAILIECCFCDNYGDFKLYDSDKISKAIVEGILNKKINANKLYRIRKDWNSASTQIGAYKDLENAKKACINGYAVFDWNGNKVYSNEDQLYRVRKSWDDYKTQIGAYKDLENAKKACINGYAVFDWNGNKIYTK